jgi:hypothetical protein
MTLLIFPSLVRRQVLKQHAELRDLFARALADTTRVLQRAGIDREQLVATIGDVRARFRMHLAFEEEALLPVLAALPHFGPEEVQRISTEHARQRQELDILIEGLESGWEMERLALVMRSLITDLLVDMNHEERGCLDASKLGDDFFACKSPGA